MRPLAAHPIALTLLICSLIACSSKPGEADLSVYVALIGPRGGTIQGPNGAELSVPAGSFQAPTPVALVLPPVGSTPPLPPHVTAVGATYDVVPHATQFSPLATVSIPFDATQVPTASTPLLLSAAAQPDGQWTAVVEAQAAGDGHMRAPVPGAGAFVVVIPTIP